MSGAILVHGRAANRSTAKKARAGPDPGDRAADKNDPNWSVGRTVTPRTAGAPVGRQWVRSVARVSATGLSRGKWEYPVADIVNLVVERARGGTSLWVQVLTDLRRRVMAGEFAAGFPTDDELCAGYGVSRATVRTAVAEMEAAGIVRRHQGRRSSVVSGTDEEGVDEEPLRSRYALTRQTTTAEHPETSDVLSCDLVTDAGPAAVLGIADDEPLVFVERRRLFGSVPLALHRSWFPTEVASGLVGADLREGSLYQLLDRLCGVRIVSGWERLMPVIPTETERYQLRIDDDTAVLRAERLALSASRPAEYRESLLRGDRFRLVANWLPADSPWQQVEH